MRLLHAARARFAVAHPDHRAIASGMLRVAAFLFLGKLAGALKEMAIAYRYGVSVEVDAYSLVLSIVSWPAELAMSMLMGVVVPMVAVIRASRPENLARFRSELLGVTLIAGIMVAGIAWFVLDRGFAGGWFGARAELAAVASGIVAPMVVLVPASFLVALWSMWTATTGRHANTLVEGVPALVIAVVVLAAGGDSVQPLVWAVLVGYAMHLAALGVPLAAGGELGAPRAGYTSPEWRSFWKGFGLVLGSQALMTSTTMIDQFFAAQIGTGAVASLGYANRILALVVGLGATAVARATLPVFSRAQATGEAGLRRRALQWSALMLGLGCVALLATWLFAPLVVRILFERGAFGAAETEAVATIVRYGAAYLPFYFSGLVLVSFCASQRRYDLVFWSGILGFVTKVLANFVLTPILGVNGLALSWLFVYAVNTGFFWIAIRWGR